MQDVKSHTGDAAEGTKRPIAGDGAILLDVIKGLHGPVPDRPKPARSAISMPVRERRLQLCARICPETQEFLDNLGFRNTGRAIDALVRAVQRREIREMIDAGAGLKLREIA